MYTDGHLIHDPKGSMYFQVTKLSPRTQLKDTYSNMDIASIQQGKIHNIWHPISVKPNINVTLYAC